MAEQTWLWLLVSFTVVRRSSFENKFWKCPIYHPTWRYYGTIIHPASNIILPWLFSAESGFFGKNHLPQFQIFWQPFLAQLLHMFGYQPSKIILRFVYSKKVNPKLNIFTCCWAPVVKKNAHPSVQRGSFDFFVGCSVAVGPGKPHLFFDARSWFCMEAFTRFGAITVP